MGIIGSYCLEPAGGAGCDRGSPVLFDTRRGPHCRFPLTRFGFRFSRITPTGRMTLTLPRRPRLAGMLGTRLRDMESVLMAAEINRAVFLNHIPERVSTGNIGVQSRRGGRQRGDGAVVIGVRGLVPEHEKVLSAARHSCREIHVEPGSRRGRILACGTLVEHRKARSPEIEAKAKLALVGGEAVQRAIVADVHGRGRFAKEALEGIGSESKGTHIVSPGVPVL